jgi:hypothetical protein
MDKIVSAKLIPQNYLLDIDGALIVRLSALFTSPFLTLGFIIALSFYGKTVNSVVHEPQNTKV